MPQENTHDLSPYWSIRLALGSPIRRFLRKDQEQVKLDMPVLETARLVLRPIVPSDLNDVSAWIPGDPDGAAKAQNLIDFCAAEYCVRGIGPWGMQLRATRKLLGNCGLPHLDVRKRWGEVNYFVAPQARGQGLAPEATIELLRFGFRDLGLTRIQARCDPENWSSERVMQKMGMTFESLVDRRPPVKGASAKQKVYTILRETTNTAPDGSTPT